MLKVDTIVLAYEVSYDFTNFLLHPSAKIRNLESGRVDGSNSGFHVSCQIRVERQRIAHYNYYLKV